MYVEKSVPIAGAPTVPASEGLSTGKRKTLLQMAYGALQIVP